MDGALAAIADGGVADVAVEPLAARLGATKGSFYWHFANRDDLLNAALAEWEERHTIAVTTEVARSPGGAMDQFRLLIRRVIDVAEGDRIGLALLATADHPAVAPVLARVTDHRVSFIAALFSELGFSPAESWRRALLAYCAYLGHAQLAHATPGFLPRAPEDTDAYIEHVLRVLTAARRRIRRPLTAAPLRRVPRALTAAP